MVSRTLVLLLAAVISKHLNIMPVRAIFWLIVGTSDCGSKKMNRLVRLNRLPTLQMPVSA